MTIPVSAIHHFTIGCAPGDLPVLLRIERNAGHGGADMVRQTVERLADQLGFLEQQLS